MPDLLKRTINENKNHQQKITKKELRNPATKLHTAHIVSLNFVSCMH